MALCSYTLDAQCRERHGAGLISESLFACDYQTSAPTPVLGGKLHEACWKWDSIRRLGAEHCMHDDMCSLAHWLRSSPPPQRLPTLADSSARYQNAICVLVGRSGGYGYMCSGPLVQHAIAMRPLSH